MMDSEKVVSIQLALMMIQPVYWVYIYYSYSLSWTPGYLVHQWNIPLKDITGFSWVKLSASSYRSDSPSDITRPGLLDCQSTVHVDHRLGKMLHLLGMEQYLCACWQKNIFHMDMLCPLCCRYSAFCCPFHRRHGQLHTVPSQLGSIGSWVLSAWNCADGNSISRHKCCIGPYPTDSSPEGDMESANGMEQEIGC